MTDDDRKLTIGERKLEQMLERAAEAGGERGVQKTFTSLGLDISTDAARIEAQKDMNFLRTGRKGFGIAMLGMWAGMASTAGAIAEGVHWLTNLNKGP